LTFLDEFIEEDTTKKGLPLYIPLEEREANLILGSKSTLRFHAYQTQ
jgi:hypothetical protein